MQMPPRTDAKPMLAICEQHSKTRKVTPNLLPCSIKHNGPVQTSDRHWKPEPDEQGHSTSYFRGRKLHGRVVSIPNGYCGVLLERTDHTVQAKLGPPLLPLNRERDLNAYGDEVEEEDDLGKGDGHVETKEAVGRACFDEILVWQHEAVPEDDDPYVKGMEEWIAFAEAIHAHN